MVRKRELSAVAATLAAGAGVGFSSGRQVALFFAQMGWASWVGVGAAAALYGALCGAVCHFANQTGARTLPGICMRALGPRRAMAACALYGLLTAAVAAMMISAAGGLAALILPVQNAFWMGALFSTGLALLLSLRGMRGMAALGIVAVTLCGALYAAMALDPREIHVYHQYVTVPELSGSLGAALALAAMHAALNAAVAAAAAAGFADRTRSAAGFAAECGLGMLILLAAANAAILRGGERLLSQAMPMAVLAARWGKFGYYALILSMWLCTVTTLSASVSALAGQLDGDGRASPR